MHLGLSFHGYSGLREPNKQTNSSQTNHGENGRGGGDGTAIWEGKGEVLVAYPGSIRRTTQLGGGGGGRRCSWLIAESEVVAAEAAAGAPEPPQRQWLRGSNGDGRIGQDSVGGIRCTG
ncbi:Os03g0162850 [Oryza sativa Japonica Group]|uniref:Os03g0162850 protein n=1 Tax=Oryza sativa subsp. japonica TaxID=39947 RepID=A0A0P0VTD4_ORYSJ|nr:Os03g0162850 [Oryza sativa Japonica Group]